MRGVALVAAGFLAGVAAVAVAAVLLVRPEFAGLLPPAAREEGDAHVVAVAEAPAAPEGQPAAAPAPPPAGTRNWAVIAQGDPISDQRMVVMQGTAEGGLGTVAFVCRSARMLMFAQVPGFYPNLPAGDDTGVISGIIRIGAGLPYTQPWNVERLSPLLKRRWEDDVEKLLEKVAAADRVALRFQDARKVYDLVVPAGNVAAARIDFLAQCEGLD